MGSEALGWKERIERGWTEEGNRTEEVRMRVAAAFQALRTEEV